jgi:hypothetical protein
MHVKFHYWWMWKESPIESNLRSEVFVKKVYRLVTTVYQYNYLNKPLSYSAAGTIRCSENKLSDLIASRTRDLSACSVAPQPSTTIIIIITNKYYN